MSTSVPPLVSRLRDIATVHRTPCDDGDMVWREWGRGAPLVLLHGGFGSWMHWVRNIDALAARHRVLAADLPGLGESAMPAEPITEERIGTIVSAGLAHVLGARAGFHLVGFSFGGLVAGQVAGMLEQRARSLTLVGASGLGLPRPPLELARRAPEMDAESRLAANRSNLRALMLHRDESLDELALYVHSECDRHARLRSRRMSLGDSLRRVLARVRTPVHGIWGEHDATAGAYLEQRESLLRELRPGCRFDIIEDAGHWVQYEASETFDEILGSSLAASA